MRQRVAPGGTIDAATPGEVEQSIARAFDQQRQHDMRRIRGTIILNAAGSGQDSADVSAQYDYILERITISGGGAPNALVLVTENDTDPTNLLEVIQMGTVGMYSDGFSNCIWVPANSVIIVSATGGVANGTIAYNLQARMLRTKQGR